MRWISEGELEWAGRNWREGGEWEYGRGKRGKGAERAIPMSREGVAVLSS
jgi:hypothetical protein